MKGHILALATIAALCVAGPATSASIIYEICDLVECCYVDSSGNGYCVELNLEV